MTKKSSNFEFRQQASLSQRTASQIPILQKLAGSDPEISRSIAVLSYLREKKLIGKDADFIIGLLNYLRLAEFATSERTNEISKMGFMLPAKEFRVIDE